MSPLTILNPTNHPILPSYHENKNKNHLDTKLKYFQQSKIRDKINCNKINKKKINNAPYKKKENVVSKLLLLENCLSFFYIKNLILNYTY